MGNRTELLAPAGTIDCFYAAMSAGADAVYAGGTRFGARAYAGNFSDEELIRAIDYAHLFGKKFYLTLNTLTKESEMKDLSGFLAPLYEAGLLSREEEDFNGQKIVPFDFILKHLPHAPKYKEEIRSFIDEGMALDSGCMVIEAYGRKDDEGVLVEVSVNAPGFVESFEKAGLTGEMYLTGQGGYLFSRLFIDDMFDGQSGVISSDMLTDAQVDRYFEYAAELDITLETRIKKSWEIME